MNSTNQLHKEVPVLIDEISSTEYYIGTSRDFSIQSAAKWRIKRIWKVGTVWLTGYPDGDQGFNYIWDNRLSYIYKI